MRKIFLWSTALLSALAVMGALLLAFCFIVIIPGLPELDVVTDYRPKIPLRIYSSEQILLAEFGQERRQFTPIKTIPPLMKKALLAIEDTRFYEHSGVDFIGVLRAVVVSTMSGSMRQGASTITMQVARDFFLTKEKLLLRKLNEVMLAYKIESALSKDKILELYMNQIYLGQRAYGFASAAQIYFGKSLQQLSIAETAMLAGLAQTPSRHNPVTNLGEATQRRQIVLKRMFDLGYISTEQYQQARAETPQIRNPKQISNHAQYAAEMVRQAMFDQYKEEAYTMGLSVITTINKAEQDAAYEAVQRNVLAYDLRHGYRGAEGFVDDLDQRQTALAARPYHPRLQVAVVLAATPKKVRAELMGQEIEIQGEGLRFAARALAAQSKIKLKPGSIIRVMQNPKGGWQISQLPEVAAAFVALDANTGGFRALVGGFDFEQSKFNHVHQAWRQPGSAMKPFIYSAALEKNFGSASTFEDTPITIGTWSPQNDDDIYEGTSTLRHALARSKNVVAVRVLQTIGADYGREFLPRFGFDLKQQPENLTLALGTGSVTPLQLAGAYAVFANGGYQIKPYLIQKVSDQRGKVLFEAKQAAKQETDRVLDARNAFIMDHMLREVVRSGTGAAATQKLGRRDLAGKTGTTNDAFDGWFAGYSGSTVAVAWMGYDDPRSLGGREFGATLSLPIWIDYMRTALANKPEYQRPVPPGISYQTSQQTSQQTSSDWIYNEFLTESNPEPEPAAVQID
jgi:penicillin-binding protein 1A